MDPLEIIGIYDLIDPYLWRMLVAEFVGTFTMVAVGLLSQFRTSDTESRTVRIAFAFGLAAAIMIQGISHISGGHINPAITAGCMAILDISILKGLLYILMQCLGAVAASATVVQIIPHSHGNLTGATTLSSSAESGFVIELLITFILVFVYKAVSDPKQEIILLGPFVIGLAIVAGHMAAYQHTGASMNSARSLGPAIVYWHWENHYIYWAGPMLGGILAAFVYKFVMEQKDEEDVKE